MTTTDLQLDGLPGPTLCHGGLAHGNLASGANAGGRAHPRRAARACLAKMRTVLSLGVPQAVLPPLARPDRAFLDGLGIGDLAQAQPWQRAVAHSTAYQWTANLGTVAPGCDTVDGSTRLLIANLAFGLHRSLEAPARLAQAAALAPVLSVLPPLPAHPELGDEGAANHSRVVGPQGVAHVFVWGRDGASTTRRFTPRQSLEASRAAARRLGLPAERCHFIRQSPAAVDAGAFHNDVVMVGQGDRLLLHAEAWVDQDAALAALTAACGPLRVRVVGEDELPLDEAVRSYLFNGQLLHTASGHVLVLPAECAEGRARQVAERLVAEGFVSALRFVAVRESMRGGGGPACLRLRLPLTEAQHAAIPAAWRIDSLALTSLESWVDTWYPEDLDPADLADPRLGERSAAALAAWPLGS